MGRMVGETWPSRIYGLYSKANPSPVHRTAPLSQCSSAKVGINCTILRFQNNRKTIEIKEITEGCIAALGCAGLSYEVYRVAIICHIKQHAAVRRR